jgi:dolichol kinase
MQKMKQKAVTTLASPLERLIREPPITPTIWPRRLFHLGSGSSIPIAAIYLPESLVMWGLISLSVLSVLGEVGRMVLVPVNDLLLRYLPFFKPSEHHQVTGATFMLLGATLVFVLFDKQVALLALLFLAVGDPMAALVGGRIHKGRIFGKSLTGTLAFVVSAGAAGLLVSLHPDVPLEWWFVPGLLSAAAAELLPIPLDDNVTVPLTGAGVMALLAMV